MHLPDLLLPGRPYPLGATWDGLGINFAVFSANAQRIDLCLFEPSGRHEIARYTLPEYTDEVWHGYLPDATAGVLYGYRAHGPYAPEQGHRFNHHKLLLDPYVRALAGNVHWSDALYGFRQHSQRGDLSFDRRDSAPAMPKGVVTDDSFNWGDDRPPAVPWSDTVIYEAHVRGLTMLHHGVRPSERGTFAGLSHPAMIDHLRRLGITAIELMPVHAFLQDRAVLQRGLRNYWGYNTLAFFAPEPSYLSDGSANEMRVAVRRLHAAGIEVILDVVYNHTAEAEQTGPTLSFRGLDNASYYRLEAGDPRRTVNDTGTGNTFNLSHPRVLQMVMDSLRHWVNSFHVDGFRFDLCSTLGREANGFDPGAGFFDALRQDPVLAGVKLIAEPWDIGPGGYQLGNHPPGFAEWNDRFRDGMRRFWRNDPGQRPEIAARLAGSAFIFAHQGRHPWATINYAAIHDGFTLTDAVSYVERHNEANGEGNRDGHPANFTSNWGVEGPTDDPAINAVRERVKRAMLATLFLAAGTPMLLAGDEFGRTQSGNNNAYCQDNELSWLDWSMAASPPGIALTAYVARLIALRREHPVLRHPDFLHGRAHPAPGIADIEWFDQSGGTIPIEGWNDIEQRTLILRRSMRVPDGKVTILTLLLNPDDRPHDFRLPIPHLSSRVLLDSAEPDVLDRPVSEDRVRVAARSLVLLYAEYPEMNFRFGASPLGNGQTEFRLWAPAQETVSVAVEGGTILPMTRSPDGWFTATAPCPDGTGYRYRLADGMLVPDPASRAQAGDVHDPSVVVDPHRFAWRNTAWRGRPWRETVLYELHAGILGGFGGVAREFPRLAALGITAVELMPVNDFPGQRNWGYDGVLPYAPDAAYGTPDDLKALVDAAHDHGLMIFLDVVYNHFGPEGNYLSLYAPQFFREDRQTPWGSAIDFRRPEVRGFFTENVLYWLMECRFDGLRFDAVHAILDQDWVDEMAATVRATVEPGRHVHLVLEHHNDASHLGKDIDAQWNDDGHNVLHVLLAGEDAGYYLDYADQPAWKLARCLSDGFIYQGEHSRYTGEERGMPSGHLPPTAFVLFLQNHDQIGNRAFGERLTELVEPAALEAAIALLMLCPQIPLLFMGEESASRTPFLFFTDHHTELADAVREGRRNEFARFPAFVDPASRERIPDPNAPQTFAASVPQADPVLGPAREALYRRLIALRATALVPRLDGARALTAEVIGPKAVVARWRLGDGAILTLASNLDAGAVPLELPASQPLFTNTEMPAGRLPGHCTCAFIDEPRSADE